MSSIKLTRRGFSFQRRMNVLNQYLGYFTGLVTIEMSMIKLPQARRGVFLPSLLPIHPFGEVHFELINCFILMRTKRNVHKLELLHP